MALGDDGEHDVDAGTHDLTCDADSEGWVMITRRSRRTRMTIVDDADGREGAEDDVARIWCRWL